MTFLVIAGILMLKVNDKRTADFLKHKITIYSLSASKIAQSHYKITAIIF